MLQLGQFVQMVANTLIDLQVHHRQFHTGKGKAVFQLFRRPPGVHRGRNRAEAERSVEAQRPLRIVPHDDGHPVALLNAVFIPHLGSELAHGEVQRAKGDALILVNEIGAVSELLRRKFQDNRNVGRRILVDLHGHAANDGLFQLQWRSRPGQQGVGLSDRHCGPIRGKKVCRHGFPRVVSLLTPDNHADAG